MLQLDKQKSSQLSGWTLGLKEEPPLSLFTSCHGSWKAAKKGILRLSKGSSFCFCGRFSGNTNVLSIHVAPRQQSSTDRQLLHSPKSPIETTGKVTSSATMVALVFWDMDGKIRDFWNDY